MGYETNVYPRACKTAAAAVTHNDLSVGVKVIVVVGAKDLLDVNVHASVVGPVVRAKYSVR